MPEEKRKCNIEKIEVDMRLFEPDYMGIYFKLNAIGLKIGQSEILGQQILELRAILGIEKLTEKERASMQQEKEMKSLWKEIIHRANTRECQKHATVKNPPQQTSDQQVVETIETRESIQVGNSSTTASTSLQMLANAVVNATKRKSKVITKYCCFHGCNNKSSMDGIFFNRIQPI